MIRALTPLTPCKEKLDPSNLDYSIESLRHIDKYLEYARDHLKELSDEEYTKIILRCGAYCGEVLKREMEKRNEKAQWLTYKNALKKVPRIKDFGESTVTFYVLHLPIKETIWFPMAKVEKFLQAGMSESLYVYARALTGGAMEKVLRDSALCDTLRASGQQQAIAFTGDKTISIIADSLNL